MLGRLLDNRYRLTKKIGEGGMGSIYLAVHSEMGRTCAIKLLAPITSGREEALARFKREAKMASRIDNPHAVTIYDFGDAQNGLLFLAMEFIDGRPLSGLIADNRTLPIDRVVHFTSQIAEALSAAHALGIVHRDLKPDNVMITHKGGDSDYVKVLDFGIAKTVADDSPDNLTKTGFVLGTPVYMSPEQLLGEKIDGRSDIYSLAIIVFEMLSGKLPFAGDNQQAVMMKRITGNPITLRSVAPHVTEAVELVVMQGLAREPDDRVATVREFAEDLSAAAHGGTQILGKGTTRRIADQPTDGHTMMWATGNTTEGAAGSLGGPADGTMVMDAHSTVRSGPGTKPMTQAADLSLGSQRLGQPPVLATEPVLPHGVPPTVRVDPAYATAPSRAVVTSEVPKRKPVAIFVIVAILVIGLAAAAFFLIPRGGNGFSVTFKNAPPGAQVSINDAIVGTIGADGTCKVADVAPGQAMIRVSKDGFLEYTQSLTGNKGDQKTVEALMLPLEIDYKGKMVLIPEGAFTMGRDKGPDDEGPAHNETLPAYYIDRYEVDNALYKRFCDDKKREYPDSAVAKDYVANNPELPVVGITYDDAEAFARWAGKRLPTEAEWEKAASWDPETQTKRIWPWGNAENAGSANLGRSAKPTLNPGGQSASDKSAYGVFDMAGNVGEWVAGTFGPYQGNNTKDDAYGKNHHVVRGASMHQGIEEARTTFRGHLPPEIAKDKLRMLLVGVRCAISANDPKIQDYLRTRSNP